MDIKIRKINLRNFKGIRDLEINFNDSITNIYGKNATGKTTIFDAFCWLLFGKDSKERSSFEIKTLDKKNNPINRLEHSVEGLLSVDGIEKKLKKIYKEKWVKKRGETDPEFSGHETDHLVDLVPVTKKDYDSIVSTLISENIFKMITNPFSFPMLNWQKKREIVIGIAGEIDSKTIAKHDKSFQNLLDQLEGRKIEDHLKIISSKKREIKEKMSHVPSRINELELSISDVNPAEIDVKMQEINAKIQEVKAEIDRINGSGSENASKRNKIQQEIKELYAKVNENDKKAISDNEIEIAKLLKEQELESSFLSEINVLEQEVLDAVRDLDDLSIRRNRLLEKYKEVNASSFQVDESDTKCKACGQELPNSADIRVEMEANFNKNKADNLDRIKKEGLELKKQIDSLQTIINDNNKKIEGVEDKKTIKEWIYKIDYKIEEIRKEIETIRSGGRKDDLRDKIAALEEEIIKDEPKDTTDQENDLIYLQDERDNILDKQRDLQRNSEIEIRIANVKKEEKTMSQELAQLEKSEFVALQFNKKKIELMEERIRNKFGNVSFKMYNTLINGGEEPTCQILIDGVPFEFANRAAQINTGIAIINTLSSHYDVKAPIFVDNAEAVNEISDTSSQLIKLVVVDKDFESVKQGDIILK